MRVANVTRSEIYATPVEPALTLPHQQAMAPRPVSSWKFSPLRMLGLLSLCLGVRGQLFPAQFKLSSLNGTSGFTLNGAAAGDFSGYSVSSAGDVNGDGVSDLLIGAFRATPSGRRSAGQTYVVFGKVGLGAGGSVELSNLNGTNGFVINGEKSGDQSGFSVSSAGDVNGDGIDDFLIGARTRGKSYVVFGRNVTVATSSRGQGQTLPQFDSTVLRTTLASISTRAFPSTTVQPHRLPSSTSMSILTQGKDQSPLGSDVELPFAIAGGVCALVSSIASAVLVFRHRDRCGAAPMDASEDVEHTVQVENADHHYTNLPAHQGYPQGHSHYTPIDEVNRQHDEYESARFVRAQGTYDDIPQRGARS